MIAKFFSVEEANKLVPELKKIINKLKRKKEKADYIEYEISLIQLTNESKIGYEGKKEIYNKKNELNEIVVELNSIIKRIHDLGCFLKDVDQGVIDFLSEKDGRPIFLCWIPNEDEISYYHEIDTGYNERKYLWFE